MGKNTPETPVSKNWKAGDWADCKKCGHAWRLREDKKPGVCAKCKNPKWDEGPKEEGKGRPAGRAEPKLVPIDEEGSPLEWDPNL